MGYAYGYDQLNRLVSMDAWVNFNTGTYAWQTSGSASSKLQERVTYDANGNITKYLRKGYSPTNMDSLTYKYYPKSNKLKRVDDAISDGTYTDIDVDDQDNNNYDYDLTGNLVKDSIEGISLITWNLMGKVDSIARYGSSSRPELKFLYDAMGNRVGKVVYDGSDVSKTWYIRDAQGNIMATYEEENDTLTWAEQHIYGSSRLGYWQPDSMMFPKPALPATDTFRYKVKAGDKLYEIANHLGNVLATITDRKIPKETGTPNGIADYYVADIATVQDYYPFGMVMPGRNWTAATANGYGFGFNGQLKDNEIMGGSNSYDFGARIYDARIGLWLSIDPLFKKYPYLSPYNYVADNPVIYYDNDGRKIKFAKGTTKEDKKLYKDIYKSSPAEFKAKLDILEDSEVKYVINFNSTTLNSGQGGTVAYDFENSSPKTDIVNIELNDNLGDISKVEALANELSGAYQFEIGQIGSSLRDGKRGNPGYELEDEVEQWQDAISVLKAYNKEYKTDIELSPRAQTIDNLINNKYANDKTKQDKAKELIFEDYNWGIGKGKAGTRILAKDEPGFNNPKQMDGTKIAYRANGKTVKIDKSNESITN